MKMTIRRLLLGTVSLLSLTLAVSFCAAEDVENTPADAPIAPIGLFDAIDQGLVEAKLTPKSSLESNLVVKNLTKEPLEVEMPAAFGGVPILAQWGGGGNRGGGGFPGGGPGMGGPGGMGGPNDRNGRNGMGGAGGLGGRSGSRGGIGGGSGSGSQSVGGGMSGGSRGGMGGGGGFGGGNRGGMGGGGWYIAPEKAVREKVRTVCLEHGKDDPRAGSDYAIVPIETCTENKTTQVLCEMLGDSEVDQQGVQAAVWNQESGLTFEELSNKVYRPTRNTPPRAWFSPDQLAAGNMLLAQAGEEAQIRAEEEAQVLRDKKRAEEEAILSGEEGRTQDDVQLDTTIEKLTEELL